MSGIIKYSVNTPKFFLCLFILSITFFSCSTIKVSSYTVDFLKPPPPSFDNFKIILIADLHNHSFGKNQYKLIERIIEQRPDIVVFAGDMIKRNGSDITNIIDLLKGISGMFPIYAVAGNHEHENPAMFEKLINAYSEYGVMFLHGQSILIERGEHFIIINSDITPFYKNEFNILLYHYGNEFDLISDEYDLVLSGHIHGGVVRIFGKGVFGNAKGSRLFPKYTKGIYNKDSGSVMVLTSGLGDTVFPRINNRREIVLVIIKVIS
jgi:predicted MPP superfamily phosphohydrolase